MPKYEPSRRNSRHSNLRTQLFNSMASKESHYKHYIPPKAVGNSAKKLGLHSHYEYDLNVRDKNFVDAGKKSVYSLRDKKGVSHGEVAINHQTKKIDWWLIK